MLPTEIVSWVFGEVAGSALHEAIRRVMGKRLEIARELLLKEISAGSALGGLPEDEVASATLRYIRAAQEGCARRNLRLMSQVMCNLKPQSPSLYADEFLRWADVIASLRREECIAVATLYRLETELVKAKTDPNSLAGQATAATQFQLVSQKICASEAEVIQTLSSAMRSGLVVSHSVWDGTAYSTTPLTQQLVQLVTIESLGSDDR